jgi:steroid 5-alpha reductase family enzyme
MYTDFQTAKKCYHETSRVLYQYRQEDLERGFLVDGLWSWCRHPNFAAEQAIWVVLYLWPCFVTLTVCNWTAVGAISILALFQGSTWLTELLSVKKYPEYTRYQERVGMFIPKIVKALSG